MNLMNRIHSHIWSQIWAFALLAIFTFAGSSSGTLPAFGQDESKPEAKAVTEEPAADKSADTATAESAPVTPVKPYAREAIDQFNQGVELHKTGYLTKAITAYKAAIQADDRIEQAWSNLGLLYTAQKSWSKAMEAFDKALELKPNSATSLNGLGTVLFAMKRNKDAMEKWQNVVQLDPNFASAYYNMGYALEMEEKRQEALKAYLQALNLSPDMSDAYYRMGLILQSTHHPAQAKLFLSKAINTDPEGAFIRDAQKHLTTIAHDLDKDRTLSTTTSVPPSNLKPSSSSSPGTEASGQSSPSLNDTKSDASYSKKESDRKGGIISSFAMKFGLGPGSDNSSKTKKPVDMFVQPPAQESDLKPKSSEGNTDF